MSTVVAPKLLTLPSDQDASGRTLGQEEMAALAEAIHSGTLTSTKGSFVKKLEHDFAALLGVQHAYACASGTAAVHIAIAALDPEPGDEIVTSSITDMGALTPILYQGAVPAFAEVDPHTCNLTADTIEPCLSQRTKAIIVTHLFGNPCQMSEIIELANARGIPVIEDCAQAFLAEHGGKMVGTISSIGAFSLQQGKHITTGEGGLVCTNDDALARRMFLFINKAWGYGDPKPDHYFLALNYRMSEIQGAVAVAQLPKLKDVVTARIAAANKLTACLRGLRGIQPPLVHPGAKHTYWKYCLQVDSKQVPGGAVALAGELKKWQIACAPRYIQKPAFMCQIFREQRTFGNSHFPFSLARPAVLNYDPSHFPMTMAALNNVLVLPWNEKYEDEHIEYIATSIHDALHQLQYR
ncbi:MAG TPA: DegT/DnrJ/EryC1/StrS family aminotransferase [Terriglobales bacterium]|nr:DegT/DnrJ/EryC1/StrS family aminotransferase [Terriglobales bacterium]